MTIRARLWVMILLPLLYGVGVVALFAWFGALEERVRGMEGSLGGIVREAHNLANLGYEMALFPNEERPVRQWRRSHQRLGGLLAEVVRPEMEERHREALDALGRDHGAMGELQHRLTLAMGGGDSPVAFERRRRLAGQMNVLSQEIHAGAMSLSLGIHREKEAELANLQRLLVLATGALTLLLAVLGWRTGRGLHRSLDVLLQGTERLGEGNLEWRLGDHPADELGNVTRAFDRMVERLQLLTASRDQLDREVAQRRQAEEELKRLLHRVETSESRFRHLLEATGDGIYGLDHHGVCTFVNPAAIRMLGYLGEGELLGRSMHEVIHHTRADGTPYPEEECLIHRSLPKGEGIHVENEVLWRRDGTCFPAIYHSHPLTSGEVVLGTVVSFTDITALQRQAADREALIQSLEERVKEQTCLFRISQSLRRRHPLEELLQEVTGHLPGGWQYPAITRGRVALEGRVWVSRPFSPSPWCLVSPILVAGERLGEVEVFYLEERPPRDEGPFLEQERSLIDTIAALLASEVERHRAEGALRLSEAQHRATLENAPHVAIQWYDAQGRVRYWNPASQQLYGWESGEAVGRTLDSLMLSANEAREFRAVLREIGRTGVPHGPYESRICRRDGSCGWVQATIFPIPMGEGETGFVCMDVEITQRKQAEESLRREKGIQETLARLGEDFLASREMAIEGISQRVLAASQEVTGSRYGFVGEVDSQTGWMITRAMTDAIFAECRVADHSLVFKERRGLWGWVVDHGQALLSNAPGSHSHSTGTPEGHVPIQRFLGVPVLAEGRVAALIAVANPSRDFGAEDQRALERIADLFGIVLERVQLERQLRHLQRLEAIGTLSAGIAHDFNNILGIISGFSELGLDKTPPDNRVHHYLEEIQFAALRGKGLVEQLLTFSRRGESPRRSLLLTPLVKEVVKFLGVTIPPAIRIEAQLAGGDLMVQGDPVQLHQLLMNLGTNAAQAIGEREGRILISLERMEVGAEGMGILASLPAGGYALLQVQDTGQGIPPDILEHVFDPFFTTKEVGKGTGLGLAVSHGIVTGHGGLIQVESVPGMGSLFRVYLPLLEGPGVEEEGEAREGEVQSGEGELLVVDDEPQLLEIYREELTAMGYGVVGTTDARQALRLFMTHPERFAALITDQAMPHLSGMDLVNRIKLVRPDLPVVLCTGLGLRLEGEGEQPENVDLVVFKPLARGALKAAMGRLLGRGGE